MKKFSLFSVVMALMIVAGMLVTGCGNQANNGGSKELQKLSVGLMSDVDSVPLIIAQEKGYFLEEGLKIDLQIFKSAMERDSALQSGNLDGAISDMLAVAFAKSGGFDVKATAFTDGNYVLIAAKTSGDTVQDLKGKDVAVSKNTIIDYVTDQILISQGMSDADINKVIIPQIPTRLEMLQNDKLPAATLPEPMASVAISNGCKHIADAGALGINPGVFMFTTKSISDKKAEIQAFYRAYNKAIKYLNEKDKSEYIDIIIKSGFPEGVRDTLKLPKYREAALPKEKDVVECIQWMNKKELIKENYSYEDIVADILK